MTKTKEKFFFSLNILKTTAIITLLFFQKCLQITDRIMKKKTVTHQIAMKFFKFRTNTKPFDINNSLKRVAYPEAAADWAR